MKFSDGEKLILIMLSEIYEETGTKGEIDPKLVKSAIITSNEWGLKWKYPGIPFEAETPPVVSTVSNYLDMWWLIEEGYAKVTEKEKIRIAVEAEPFGTDVIFRGFDGNNETEYMNVAHFLINELDRFSTFKDRDLNSHAPAVEVLERMYSVFVPMKKAISGRGLSADQIIELLKAKANPGNS